MNPSMQAEAKYSDTFLDRMRKTCDPPADAAVAALFAEGDVAAVNTMMRNLVSNDDLVPASFPPPIQAYLEASQRLPSWADQAKIVAGERVFWRYGPEIVAIFHCYSLPFCYAAWKGVQVLSLTGRLTGNPTRRITETAQMIIEVMQPGGLGAAGTGVRTAQKVRLMHAGVRHQIRQWGHWNPAFDEPVNQEDLAGTLMAFAWITLEGLRKLGFPLSEEEREAFLYSWRVVGHVMGILPELVPGNLAEADALVRAIERRLFGPCAEGKQMTAALVGSIQELLPGNVFASVPGTMMRYFLGDATADSLGVEHCNMEVVLLEPLKVVNLVFGGTLSSSEPLARVHEVFSRKLIEGLVYVRRGGQRIPFTIPTELRQAWGVNWVA